MDGGHVGVAARGARTSDGLAVGAALPAAADLGPLLEGYGLHVAGTPDPDEQLRDVPLPPLGHPEAGGDLGAAMALSFVRTC